MIHLQPPELRPKDVELLTQEASSIGLTNARKLQARFPAADPSLRGRSDELDLARRALEYNARISTEFTPGGLMPVGEANPYYDPKRALLAGERTLPGELISSDLTTRGAPYVELPALPRTQYAPEGDLVTEPLVLEVPPRGVCVCAQLFPNTLQLLFMSPVNAMKLRCMLEQVGVVRVPPALQRVTHRNSCACRILGGREGAYEQIALYSLTFADTLIVSMPEPVRFINSQNTAYIQKVTGELRTLVNQACKQNYIRAEGARAFMQPRPGTTGRDAAPQLVPAVLPFTGNELLPEDTVFSARAFTGPMTGRARINALALVSGLPVGQG